MSSILEERREALYSPLGPGAITHVEEGMSAASILRLLAKHRRLIAAMAMIGATAGVGVSVFRVRYTATSAFMPQAGSSAASRVSGLAAQLGISVGMLGGKNDGDTPDFYAALLE